MPPGHRLRRRHQRGVLSPRHLVFASSQTRKGAAAVARRVGVAGRYLWVLVREFRWTLVLLALAVAVGAFLLHLTPHEALGGRRPSVIASLFGAWMALFAQPILTPPETWYLALMDGVYPLFGFGLIGEGVVRIGLLILSRARGEKEWMKVMASTYRDHVVLCGLGHLGFRVLERLLESGADVVVIEKDEHARFLAVARATGVPILLRDMKEDQALLDAGIVHSRAIIIATNDDMANIEVALDARRLNPDIRVIMRLYDQQIAGKIKDAFAVDEAFSASALAAPAVAAMSIGSRVLASFEIGGVPHLTVEVTVTKGGGLAGRSVGDLEAAHGARVLAVGHGSSPARPAAGETRLGDGDTLVVHAPAAALPTLLKGMVAKAS